MPELELQDSSETLTKLFSAHSSRLVSLALIQIVRTMGHLVMTETVSRQP
jgi:hypothetical protein